MKWLLLGVFGLILAFALGLMIRLGLFKPVHFEIATQPEMILLYKEHHGAYHKIVPVIQEVEAWAGQQAIDCSSSFGMYLDDPEKVEELRLRSLGGCVLQTQPTLPLPENLHIKILPPQKYIVAKFTGSPSIGPFKVYSPAKDLANEQRKKLMPWNIEVYFLSKDQAKTPEHDIQMTTTYFFPIED